MFSLKCVLETNLKLIVNLKPPGIEQANFFTGNEDFDTASSIIKCCFESERVCEQNGFELLFEAIEYWNGDNGIKRSFFDTSRHCG